MAQRLLEAEGSRGGSGPMLPVVGLSPFLGCRRGRSLGTYKQSHPFADMTFIHEGNHTLVENLVNFEKMVSLWKVGSHLRCESAV